MSQPSTAAATPDRLKADAGPRLRLIEQEKGKKGKVPTIGFCYLYEPGGELIALPLRAFPGSSLITRATFYYYGQRAHATKTE